MRRLLLTLLFINFVYTTYAQLTNRGKEFIITFSKNYEGRSSAVVYVTGEPNSTLLAKLNYVGENNRAKSYTLDENGYLRINLSDDLGYIGGKFASSSDQKKNAVSFISQQEFSLTGVNVQGGTTDGFLAYPKESLGSEYIVVSPLNDATSSNAASFFTVTATEDNTNVLITRSDGREMGSYSLSKYESFRYTAAVVDGDVSGLKITSNNNLAVFSGNQVIDIPVECGSNDYVVEQIPPISSLGYDYLLVPQYTGNIFTKTMFKFVFAEDNTVLELNIKGTNYEIKGNSGDSYVPCFFNGALTNYEDLDRLSRNNCERTGTYFDKFDELMKLHSDKPLLVAQMGGSGGFASVGDPFMVILSATNQSLINYQVSTSSQFENNYLVVSGNKNYVNSTTIDNPKISSQVYNYGLWSIKIFNVPKGIGEFNHILNSNGPIGLSIYGYEVGGVSSSSYGFLGGQSFSEIALATNLTLTVTDLSKQINELQTAISTVSDQNENPLANIRVDFTISGSHTERGSIFTDANGQAVFTYAGDIVGTDKIIANVALLSQEEEVHWVDPCPTTDDSKRGNIWYFGQVGAGLDFNDFDASGDPTLLPANTSSLRTSEGCATMCDQNGDLLFYTDGITIWDKNNVSMNVVKDGDPSSTQSGIIVPNPANGEQYFVFATSVLNDNLPVSYCIIDMTLNNGDGGVLPGSLAILGSQSDIVKEKIVVVAHKTREAYWVVVPQFNSSLIYAYLIDETGTILSPVESDILVSQQRNIGQFVASPNGTKIASSNYLGSGNVELFDFNASTGIVSNRKEVEVTNGEAPYGACFSPNSKVLYISYVRGGVNGPSSLVQFDVLHETVPEIIASMVELEVLTSSSHGGIQIGPDERLYVKISDDKVGVIKYPNIVGVGCEYSGEDNAITGLGSGFGLPNIVPSFLVPSNEIKFTCNEVDKRINFKLVDNQGNVLNDGSEISWDFGDGSTVVLGASVSHTYASTDQDYNIIVTITKDGCPKEVKAVASFTDCCGEVNIRKAELVHCFGKEKTFRAVTNLEDSYSSFIWNVGEGDEITTTVAEHTHTYTSTGFYELSLTAIGKGECGDITIPAQVEVEDCINCETCVTSFSPKSGEEYLVGAWVKVDYVKSSTAPVPGTYKNVGVEISFNNGDLGDALFFKPSGPIVDGWQRIEGSFIVPKGAYNMVINAKNDNLNDAFFDDIRIHPFRSNMKSYVYDPSTQRLTAELDENNYATYYEYDDEGVLVRVKKETERGVMTIQETRMNHSKINK